MPSSSPTSRQGGTSGAPAESVRHGIAHRTAIDRLRELYRP